VKNYLYGTPLRIYKLNSERMTDHCSVALGKVLVLGKFNPVGLEDGG
jgi:hypothetical protein